MSTSPTQTDTQILLVEDDDVDAMSVTRALTRLHVQNTLYRAHDGIEALALLRDALRSTPVIVLLDLNMPRMSGLEFLQALRDDPQLTGTVVFVLTTSESENDIAAAYQQHVAGYIVKNAMQERFLHLTTLLDNYWKIVTLPK